MILTFSGHNEKYLCESLAMLFFPGTDFRTDDGKNALIKLIHNDNRATAQTELSADGRHESATVELPLTADKQECFTQAIAKSFYLAASAMTGIEPPWGTLTGIRPAKKVKKYLDEGKTPEQAAVCMRKSYLCRREKTLLCSKAAKAETEAERLLKNDTASLYISIPFCPSRCSYCSFVSHSIDKAAKLMPRYTELLIKEISWSMKLARERGIAINTVYVGGGTPTALQDELFAELMGALKDNLSGQKLLEFTVEAGRPDTVTHSKLELIKSAGASRISINPQTLSDKTLQLIGRRHTAADFFEAFRLARDCGFQNINCDLIAGLPEENCADFIKTLDGIAALEPENITVHTLCVKKASNIRKSAETFECESKEIAGMVEYSQKALDNWGYLPYYLYRQKNMLGNFENVGFTKENKACLYNIYSMGELQSIISVGAGAVSKHVDRENDVIKRIYNPKYPYEYIDRFENILEEKTKLLHMM